MKGGEHAQNHEAYIGDGGFWVYFWSENTELYPLFDAFDEKKAPFHHIRDKGQFVVAEYFFEEKRGPIIIL